MGQQGSKRRRAGAEEAACAMEALPEALMQEIALLLGPVEALAACRLHTLSRRWRAALAGVEWGLVDLLSGAPAAGAAAAAAAAAVADPFGEDAALCAGPEPDARRAAVHLRRLAARADAGALRAPGVGRGAGEAGPALRLLYGLARCSPGLESVEVAFAAAGAGRGRGRAGRGAGLERLPALLAPLAGLTALRLTGRELGRARRRRWRRRCRGWRGSARRSAAPRPSPPSPRCPSASSPSTAPRPRRGAWRGCGGARGACLRRLALGGAPLGPDALRALPRFPLLESLAATLAPVPGGEELVSDLFALPRLRALSLRIFPGVSLLRAVAAGVQRAATLEALDVSFEKTPRDADGGAAAAALVRAARGYLRSWSCSVQGYCVGAEELAALAEGGPQLRRVEVAIQYPRRAPRPRAPRRPRPPPRAGPREGASVGVAVFLPPNFAPAALRDLASSLAAWLPAASIRFYERAERPRTLLAIGPPA
eukprot:tig00020934_g16088.t1